jgi:hypothetical protein
MGDRSCKLCYSHEAEKFNLGEVTMQNPMIPILENGDSEVLRRNRLNRLGTQI